MEARRSGTHVLRSLDCLTREEFASETIRLDLDIFQGKYDAWERKLSELESEAVPTPPSPEAKK